MFKPETYIERRKALKRRLMSGVVLFLGNDRIPMNFPANTYRFYQDASFLYYWGIDLPDLAAIMDIDTDRDILFGDDCPVEEIIWTGPQIPLKQLAIQCGANSTEPAGNLMPFLDSAIRKQRPLHFLPQYRTENILKIEQAAKILGHDINRQVSQPLVQAVIEQRLIKSADEIMEIESALEITGELFVQAIRESTPGMFEYQVIGRAEGLALARNSRPAHHFIFTVRGERLHGSDHSCRMKAGDMVIMDGGVESSRHYASDITRSFPVSPHFSGVQKKIYDIVLKANETSIQMIRPGIPFRDIHRHAAAVITEGLQELGLMTGNVQDSVHQGAHALFFPHGLGHPLGLEIHDLESLGEEQVGYDHTVKRSTQFGLSNLRFARSLKEGMVMTVEPGIYFIPELIHSWRDQGICKAFINYDQLDSFMTSGGIRIEDDILVTETGARNLSVKIPKQVTDIEEVKSSFVGV